MTTTLSLLFDRVADAFHVRRPRPILEWAEEEFLIPTGPYQGLPFRCSRMPWTRLILEEFGRDRFQRYWASGPTQTSKTLLFVQIPAAYYLFELAQDIGIAVPRMKDATEFWSKRIKPVIEANPAWARLMPTKGPGSRGGIPELVRFKNGATLHFFSGSGEDEERSSVTVAAMFLTEVDKYDTSKTTSRESDPITQLWNRCKAHGEGARLFAECTLSTEDGRTFIEIAKFGTDSRIYLRCQHCQEWVDPVREQFLGWAEAETVGQAKARGRYRCQLCGEDWSEEDRLAANQEPRLVARGQTVNELGEVEGEVPDTSVWGGRWNSMHSVFTDQARLAEEEWRALQLDTDDARKNVLQFYWALPWKGERMTTADINVQAVLRHVGRTPRGEIPEGTQHLTGFVDLGLYQCWWSVWAWTEDGRGCLVDYASIEVDHDGRNEDEAILESLREWRDTVEARGWGERRPELWLMDIGWAAKAHIVRRFCHESGPRRWMPARGRGSAPRQRKWVDPSGSRDRVRQIGDGWYLTTERPGLICVTMHSDRWKKTLHGGFLAPLGVSGSLELYHADPSLHVRYAKQILAEYEREEWEVGKGVKIVWHQASRKNHYLDCAYGARVAASILGWSPPHLESGPQAPPARAALAPTPRSRPARERRSWMGNGRRGGGRRWRLGRR